VCVVLILIIFDTLNANLHNSQVTLKDKNKTKKTKKTKNATMTAKGINENNDKYALNIIITNFN
jgi:hypothetical protein